MRDFTVVCISCSNGSIVVAYTLVLASHVNATLLHEILKMAAFRNALGFKVNSASVNITSTLSLHSFRIKIGIRIFYLDVSNPGEVC